MIPVDQIIIRMLVAFVLSMLFGLERQVSKKPTGFGTFTFVTVGATVLTIIAQDISDTPISLFGAIVTGIGFLGAGAIIKGGDKKVAGITTAASIWAFAALGIAVGIGLYTLALIFYILMGIIILIDHYFERYGFGAYSKTVTVTLSEATKMKRVEEMLPEQHKVFSYNLDHGKKEYTMSFSMSGNKVEINMTLNEILKQPGVMRVTVE